MKANIQCTCPVHKNVLTSVHGVVRGGGLGIRKIREGQGWGGV